MFSHVVALVFITAAIVQLGFALALFWPALFRYYNDGRYSIAIHRAQIPEYPVLPISVIICAHNEEDALRTNLPSILQQNYHDKDGNPCYEVIVVNDRSDDSTASILEELSAEYHHLKIVTILPDEPRTFPGKKFALSRAVAAAQHDHILMTDADCQPAGKAWILWMSYPFSRGKEIIAGFGGFHKEKGFLNSFIRLETIHTFVQYLSYARAGIPYMAVGRNLAVKKSLLLKAQSHPHWSATASGDDDMLIQACATKENMTVNVHPASFTFSHTKSTWSEYLSQKQRHTSTGKYYSPCVQYLLGAYALSHGIFWLCTVLFLANPDGLLFSLPYVLYQVVSIAWLVRFISYWTIFYDFSARLTYNARLKFFWPIFDISWAIYNLILSPYILWKNKQQWK